VDEQSCVAHSIAARPVLKAVFGPGPIEDRDEFGNKMPALAD
jgi:hypothetical protein